MTNKTEIKQQLLAHSKAKVALYSEYLEAYLSVLSNSKYINTVNIFDLMCGEGLYDNNQKGSPISALEKMSKVFSLQTKYTPKINLLFNDNGKSEIEKNISKIDRLKDICASIKTPINVSIEYRDQDFTKTLQEAIEIAHNSNKSKSLFFIDPYGYKGIKPQFIRSILSNKSSELILFLPASHMYRFAKPAQNKNFAGGEPLAKFLSELFGDEINDFSTTTNFINSCKKQFKSYLKDLGIYVETFTLERDSRNTYCLFFFTSSELGFLKMLETKWKIDTEQGKGFTVNQQPSLFSGITYSPYPKMLETFLTKNPESTNGDLFMFGLKNGYLPKHTKEALNHLKNTGIPITISSTDDKPVKGYYISYKNFKENPERVITFRVGK